MALHSEYGEFRLGDLTTETYIAYDNASGSKRPAVLVAHQWGGPTDHERAKAEALAGLGYVGIAIDVYGKGVRGRSMDEESPAHAAFHGLMEDRALLRERLLATVELARQHPLVDPARIAMIGYCFGGVCALDAARAAAPGVRGVVSLHGVFPPPNLGPEGRIDAKVLVLHGYDDPLAPPDSLLALARELTDAGADWQIHAYGHTVHAFTVETANNPARGLQYSAAADRRSWKAMQYFLDEVLGQGQP